MLDSKDLGLNFQNFKLYVLANREQNLSSLGLGIAQKLYVLEKHGLYATKHTQRKINRSTSFAIDNMYYVNFKI